MFMKLCAMEDIPPGEMKKFDLKEEEILVVNLSGQFYCLEARCSHAGSPLYEGSLEDTVLTCPWHCSQFDIIDGSVLRGPANKPLRVYRTEIKDRQIFVETERPDGRKF
jgi:nitrite reductase/ring-hydroxylating ferredoxin subunit